MDNKLELSNPHDQNESDDGRIHKVPKSLSKYDPKKFYHPQVVFLGPYHFEQIIGKKDDEMELLKTDIARDVHLELKKKRHDPSDIVQEMKEAVKILEGKEKEESSVDVNESVLKRAIKTFEEKEEKIKKSYAEQLDVTGEVLSRIMARDACFVVHVLQTFRQDEAEETKLASINRSLSGKRYHPLMTDIVKDVLKMENQLPLWALREISPHENDEWLVSALKNLSPINVANERSTRDYKREYHILQLLRDYMVDSQQISASTPSASAPSAPASTSAPSTSASTSSASPPSAPASASTPSASASCYESACESACDWFTKICCDCKWNNLPILFRPLVCLGSYFFWTIILIVLSPVLFVMLIIFFCSSDFVTPNEWENVLTVEELKKLGVKFKRLNRQKRGISHIKFKCSTLYLPQFKVDNRSEVILRNLIALEICSKDEENPITSYAIMMNDLINTREDVAILRREDIIINKLGSDEEVAKLWNTLVPSTVGRPSYRSINDVVSGIDSYRKRNLKILWAQFVMTYCSKPWLFSSLLAGLILLVLTLLQTTCLFVSCQAK